MKFAKMLKATYLLSAVTGAGLSAATVAGLWDATVHVKGAEIPFRIEFSGEGRQLKGWFFNGDEKIVSTSGRFEDGRLTLQLDHYATRLEAMLRDGTLSGVYGRPGREYVFRARPHTERRTIAADAPEISGLWEIAVKSPKGESAWRLAVKQSGDEVSAAILRVDGDTGALTGHYQNGKFVLSHFSGARPALVTLMANGDGSLTVDHHGKGTYIARRPEAARRSGLETYTDPASHTTVAEAREPLRFQFPDLSGKLVSEGDVRGKVVLLHVMGSWCPNCHDEAPYLAQLDAKYRSRGLAIVALSFEEADQLQDPVRLRAFVKQYGLQFPVLLGGEPEEVQTKLPRARNLNAWPTTFFLDRDGQVRHVHAGFAGRGSGELHEQTKRELTNTIESLLAAESN